MKLKDNKKVISPYCLCHSLLLSHLEAELIDETVGEAYLFFFPYSHFILLYRFIQNIICSLSPLF
jgi:hypothetical protein